jgi:dipeptidyl aminopeptidase/acylaminoacyl peptidase
VDLPAGKTAAQRDSLYRLGLMALDSATATPGWVKFFSDYDPLPVVRKVRAPVLIVHGATDRQVTAEQAEILGSTLRSAGNADVAVHVLPDVNHLFLSDPVGHVAGYSALSKRMVVPQLLQLVTDWIVNKSK